jgi:ppGpp synthetase/RelA/SpoT-type nucleotidyltranferase
MSVSSVIESFLEHYDKSLCGQYRSAAAEVASKLKARLEAAQIPALVFSREKEARSLRNKLTERAKEYGATVDFDYIQRDVKDLAGARVLVYFPRDRGSVESLIFELFRDVVITQPKTDFGLPNGSRSRLEKADSPKRFRGYAAEHYVVSLELPEGPTNRLTNHAIRVEIQVTTLFMHAWSEVEHDIVYKPKNPKLADLEFDEAAILDAVNGAVATAEVLFEALQQKLALRGALPVWPTTPSLFDELWAGAESRIWIVGPNLYSLVADREQMEERVFRALRTKPALQVQIVVADPRSPVATKSLSYAGPLFFCHLWSAIEVFRAWERRAAASGLSLRVNTCDKLERETLFLIDPDIDSGTAILRRVFLGSRPEDRPLVRIAKGRHPATFEMLWQKCMAFDLRDIPNPDSVEEFWAHSTRPEMRPTNLSNT